MSPSELAAVAAVAQQVLGLVMMPMMPFVLPMNPALVAAAMAAPAPPPASSSSATAAADTVSELQPLEASPPHPADSLSDVLAASASPLALLGAPFALPTAAGALGADDAPKRKRGRPPKKDAAAARARADAERALKQLPVWGYGLPLFPTFPGVLSGSGTVAPSALTALSSELPASTTLAPKEEEEEEDVTGGKPPAKKKTRGTGRPRGRPRTRPRPGEIVRRVKPLTIAPATTNSFPAAMYTYQQQLSSLSKGAELSVDAAGASHDDARFAGLGASLLSGEHE